MYIKMIKNLRGYVKIRVTGSSRERFLNLCHTHGIQIWGIEAKHNIYEMYIFAKDYKKLRPIVRKTGTVTVLMEKRGLPFLGFRFRKRKIFLIGMILSFLLIYVFSLYVWDIEVSGNITQNKEEILQCLDEAGITHGARKSQIECEEIEKLLRIRYPEMLWVSAELQGSRIMIHIKENDDKDIVSEIKEKNIDSYSIVADESGEIEEIIVRNGTPLVKKGDRVEKGQILVEGYYEIKDDYGNILRYEPVYADADIRILKTQPYNDCFSLEYISKKYTDKKRLGVRIGWKEKVYQWNPEIPFKFYETIRKNKEFYVTKSFCLPLKFESIWYLEYIPEVKTRTEKEIKTVADRRFYKKYENNIQKGVQIIEKDVKIDINGKLCHVSGSLKVSVPVTKKIPTILPQVINGASVEGDI